MTTHEITVERAHKLDARGDWWQARCSCGTYASGVHGFIGKAERAGAEHVRAKTTSGEEGAA